ncbi:MAG: bifunctional demethylmenaquinone methyltransferase/2-methoxy-6-polyprenyl-1,4-benzoquinol methylase UbiE [Bacteroidota bacterium]
MPHQDVGSLFDSIAYRYDLLNHLLSGGIDHYWRRRAIAELRDLRPRRVIDVATGTADLAIAAARLNPERIVGVDIAGNMLALGRRKVAARGLDRLITLQGGTAEQLEFPDASFDAAIVAFGVRNFADLAAGLAEMRRVIRPGGMIVILEFSRPAAFPFKQLYFLYFRRVIPFVGRIVSRHDTAYRYLPETVMKFPQDRQFLDILSRTGFSSVSAARLTFGIVSIYTGVRTS